MLCRHVTDKRQYNNVSSLQGFAWYIFFHRNNSTSKPDFKWNLTWNPLAMFSRQLKRTSILPSLDESRRQRWVSIVTPDRHTHVERLPSIPGQRPLTTTCSRIYLYSLGHIHSNDAQTWTVCCLSASVLLATAPLFWKVTHIEVTRCHVTSGSPNLFFLLSLRTDRSLCLSNFGHISRLRNGTNCL